MEPTFSIDEYQIDTTHSFLNSGCTFTTDSVPVATKNEACRDNTYGTNATTKSFDSGVEVDNYHLPANKIQEDAKKSEIAVRNLPLYSSNSEYHFPLLHQSYRNTTENIDVNVNRNSPSNVHSSHSAHTSHTDTYDERNSEVSFIKELFSGKFNKNCTPLTSIINKTLRKIPVSQQNRFITKLKGHVGVYESGNPWIDLEACCLLNLNGNLKKTMTGNDELPKEPPLPDKIKFALAEGRHVPIQHIILGLHLSQFNPELKEYPINFTTKIDSEFVQKINRSDVLRAINIHSLFLGSKFPQIGIQFSSIKEYLWQFMFRKKFSAVAGMELYNEIFFNFSCNMGRGVVITLSHIPHRIVEKVINIYKNV